MLDTSYYKVTREIAQRSGLINVRYRTQDGFYILDNNDLSRIRIKSSEYLTGLQGVQPISKEEAKAIIEQNGYKMGAAPMVEDIKQPTENVKPAAEAEPVATPEATPEEPEQQEEVAGTDAEPAEEEAEEDEKDKEE